MSGIASDFLRPSAQQLGVVSVDNGWSEKRFSFLIEIAYYEFSGELSARKILQGYTNHLGATMSGAMDPQMILYFNNVVTLRNSYIPTEHGQALRTSVGESSQLLRGDYSIPNAFDTPASNLTHLMRPQDVFNSMGRQALMGNDEYLDTRMMFSDSPIKKSNRQNNSAPHYVSGVLRGFRDTGAYADQTENMSNVMADAAGTVKDENVSQDRFFHELVTRTSNFTEGGYVTYGELQSVFPEFDHVAGVIFTTHTNRTQQPYEQHHVGQTEHWGGSDNETIWSTILTQTLPSLMMPLMLTRVAFVATNQTLNGQLDVRVMDAQTFATGLDLTPYAEKFTQDLTHEVLRGLSQNNGIDFYLQMMTDVTGETRIEISIAGSPIVEFASPSFCDGLYAPVLTNNQLAIDAVAHDIQGLAGSLGTQTRYNQNHSPIITQGGMNGSLI